MSSSDEDDPFADESSDSWDEDDTFHDKSDPLAALYPDFLEIVIRQHHIL